VATTINTAIDALSHAVEGMLTVRSAVVSEALAKESMRLFVRCVPAMKEALAKNAASAIDQSIREDLAQCSMLAGMVIAQTGTTIVHGMGYSLTYFKNIDHGRANGLLLAEYLRLVEKEDAVLTSTILTAMSLKTVDEFKTLMETLLGEKEGIAKEEILKFSDKAIKTPNINNCKVRPTQTDIEEMYTASF
jgi:alcohol dehydrogenase class IV